MGKEPNGDVSKDDTRMANKLVRRCSESLGTRDLQVNCDHVPPQTHRNVISGSIEALKRGNPAVAVESSVVVPRKIKTKTVYDPASPLLDVRSNDLGQIP